MATTSSETKAWSSPKSTSALPAGRYPAPNNAHHLNPHGLLPGGVDGPKSLEYERSRATFPLDNVTRVLYSDNELEMQERVIRVVSNDPVFDKTHLHHRNHEEAFLQSTRAAYRLNELSRIHKWGNAEWHYAYSLLEGSSPMALNLSMFIQIIRTEGSAEQQKDLINKIVNFNIIGCYAQTELGHGSNVQGLETEVSYIEATDELEVNSPYLTSGKWWIGALGKSCTHVGLMAQLIIKGRSYGIHSFVFRIRSEKDHSLLPGVIAGDIGTKYGHNGLDNGCAWFYKFRVPKSALLNRFSNIDTKGNYVRNKANSKLVYNSMMSVRAGMVRGAAGTLARAATIAVRYSAIRRQTANLDPVSVKDKIGEEYTRNAARPAETQILNYPQQQYRLFTSIAKSYALHFVGMDMMAQYNSFMDNLNKDDFDRVAQLQPEIHATSSSLKSLVTNIAYDAIEDLRRCCGGHGYLTGMANITNNDYGMMVTGEGDNYMISLQCTRYLLKTFNNLKALKEPNLKHTTDTTEYLLGALKPEFDHLKCRATSQEDLLNVNEICTAFAVRAGRLVKELAQEITDGATFVSRQWEANRVSKAHGQYIIITSFAKQLDDKKTLAKLGPDAAKVMRQLFELFALSTMECEPEFGTMGYLSWRQYSWIRSLVRDIIDQVRPNAVALVDAWNYSDFALHSALGRYDGRVYETMVEWASKEPLNNGKHWPAFSSWNDTYRPMLENDGKNGSVVSRL
ncbi:acyl-CoA oxidase [Synchytrium microbalum]|uniref:Acyl-coenzyme A oxidase n=1 Tax=Synchytrium microbalum TaxID=1806994 RepID=A0A507C2A8_9FUNG|nr:acyl-CoA oxidase [Synchytrium microbalum]TPX31643.1 acyl-CoA oxidase [Synchytrium microbalum]